ncbi:MnhB domain-containing protein [Phaeacidiphilus oryzae]|uniref:MnhB domain-containing protein n=1 Tax=Phaeacidiphilus oryzae TaxID=348818 RepID=UPI000A06FE99|nr:MnhB domain-containing protein [Phaeacidiphilus oryzae]
MNARRRGRLLLLPAAVLAAGLVWCGAELPVLGTDRHPYGARSVAAALRQHTSNAVSSINFDQRALDTLGEESILFAAVLGAVVLLRQVRGERRHTPRAGYVLPSTRLFGVGLLPVALLTGVYVVAHGAVTPGGGFQGGVVLASGLHVAYVAADYRVLRRLRPLVVLESAEAVAAGSFAGLGLAGLACCAAYLKNVLPLGAFGQLASGGLVGVLNAAVGVAVASGVVVLLAGFLEQAVELDDAGEETTEGEG